MLNMPNRVGVNVGGFVDPELAAELDREAGSVRGAKTRILEEMLRTRYGKAAPRPWQVKIVEALRQLEQIDAGLHGAVIRLVQSAADKRNARTLRLLAAGLEQLAHAEAARAPRRKAAQSTRAARPRIVRRP